MRQTVEESAMKYASGIVNKSPLGSVHYTNFIEIIVKSYMQGAEWQKEQSQWISVEDELPPLNEAGESEYVLVRHNDFIPIVAKYCTEEYHACPEFGKGRNRYRSHWIKTDFCWVREEITHWLPIPSFDEILEANKDVLQRMKENGY